MSFYDVSLLCRLLLYMIREIDGFGMINESVFALEDVQLSNYFFLGKQIDAFEQSVDE